MNHRGHRGPDFLTTEGISKKFTFRYQLFVKSSKLSGKQFPSRAENSSALELKEGGMNSRHSTKARSELNKISEAIIGAAIEVHRYLDPSAVRKSGSPCPQWLENRDLRVLCG